MSMTPKAQAIYLVSSMGISTSWATNYTGGEDYPMYKNQYAKECALIAVDKLIEIAEDDVHLKSTVFSETHRNYKSYWRLVKTEIEKL
jgi:hypothetical protein